MLENMNTLLEKGKDKTQELIKEIKQYKDSKELNQNSTESLEQLSQALLATTKKIKPYTETRMNQFQLAVLILLSINAILLIIILLVK